MPHTTPTLPLYMRRDHFAPVEELRAIRETDGVARIETAFGLRAWLVTRWADVREVLGDAARFSNRTAFLAPNDARTAEEAATARAGQLLAMDPPEHTRLRRLLTPEFTVRRIQRLEPRIVEIVDQHLDALATAGSPADLVPTFALPIPSLVICELLGVPYADRADFQARTARQLDLSLPVPERMRLAREGRAYMASLVARAQVDPGEDLLGMLVREHSGDVTDDELVGIGSLLLIAGHETTSNMLGLGTLALLRQPDQLARVRDDPAVVQSAMEELLRWLTIVHSGVVRTATADTVVAGQRIAEGELVVCSLPTANRDPALIADPERLDVTRGTAAHVAFGHGVHHCLGAPLARMEMRVAFPALLRRFPGLALDAEFDEVPFRAFHFIYGLQALPVRW